MWFVFLAVVRGAGSISPALGGAIALLWIGTGIAMLCARWVNGGPEDAPIDTGRPSWMEHGSDSAANP